MFMETFIKTKVQVYYLICIIINSMDNNSMNEISFTTLTSSHILYTLTNFKNDFIIINVLNGE